MKKSDLREKIHLTSVDELFGLENAESSIEIAIDRIRSFKNHPFKVLDDDKMADLVESIKANGVLTPVVVRGNDGDGYEMISGHRRLHASKLAGRKKIPAFVRDLSDDEATIVMVDSNKVYNIKAYLLAALFNAGTTMSNYYRAEVNHDMPQFAG